MTGLRVRALGAASLAVACTAVVTTTPALTSGMRSLAAEVSLIVNEDLGWIMGGTGNPIPDMDYIDDVKALYLGQYSGYHFEGLQTPEQFCPIICDASQPSLGFGDSVNAGAGDLHNVVVPALNAGDNVSVLGYSQSAVVTSQLMNQLISANQANLDDLHVTLLGDPSSPIGGILDRFQFPDGVGAFSVTPEPQHVPFLDIPLGTATTPLSGIATDIYTGEYDGFANFPEDPSNLFADINALIGIETVHPYYPDPTPGVNLDTNTNDIINLGTIGNTHFHDIFAPLPTLAFMYDGGPAGKFFYDAFVPNTSLGIDWAYGNPGDPAVGVNGTDEIGPWQVNATGQLVASGVAGLIPKMDPLQMLAGEQFAAVQTLVGPINDLLKDAGQSPLSQSFVDSLLSGYHFTNQLDASLLTTWTDLTASMPSLAPDAILDGSPLISGQPLVDLVGYGFDVFNFFGA